MLTECMTINYSKKKAPYSRNQKVNRNQREEHRWCIFSSTINDRKHISPPVTMIYQSWSTLILMSVRLLRYRLQNKTDYCRSSRNKGDTKERRHDAIVDANLQILPNKNEISPRLWQCEDLSSFILLQVSRSP